MRRPSTRIIGVVFLLVNVVCWGASLPIVKPALAITTPFQFLFYRFALAALLSIPILIYYLMTKPELIRSIPKIIRIETFQTVIALALIYEGLARTTSLEASLIVTALPFFVTLGGIFWLREREEKHEWAGLLLALAGTVALTLEPALDGRLAAGKISVWGNILVIGYNFAMAAYLLSAKRGYQKLPKFFSTAISFWVGLIAFACLAMWKQQLAFPELLATGWLELHEPSVMLASVYMATFGSIIGLTALIIGQSKMEASEASLFTYLEPLIYLPLAVIFLKEPVTPGVILALALITGGVVIAEIRVKDRALRRSRPKRRSR